MPLSRSARVRASSAAIWRYVNSTSPSRRRAYSGSIGSFTFKSNSASPQTSSSETIRAPAASYAASEKELPSPAPVSTVTSCPRCPSSRAPAGVSATRYSSVLISLATPIFKAASPYLVRVVRLGSVEIQEQPGQCLGIFDLAHLRCDLVPGPTDDLELFVALRTGFAALEALGEEEVHSLAAEAGSRVEGLHRLPGPACQARLLRELSPSADERCLARLERACRQLEKVSAHRLAPLANEGEHPVAIDRDYRDGAGVLDDFALVFAPALERDVDQLPVVDGSRGVRLHAARRSTRRRCSASNQGGLPAAAFSPTWPGLRVAGITTSTRSSEIAHFRSAWTHDSTPSCASASSGTERRKSVPSPSGRMTITAMPSSVASGRISCSHSRSCGLRGT